MTILYALNWPSRLWRRGNLPSLSRIMRKEASLLPIQSIQCRRQKAPLSKTFATIKHHPGYLAGSFRLIKNGSDIHALAHQLSGSMGGWEGYSNSHGGFARAGKAMHQMYQASKAWVSASPSARKLVMPPPLSLMESVYWREECTGMKTKSETGAVWITQLFASEHTSRNFCRQLPPKSRLRHVQSHIFNLHLRRHRNWPEYTSSIVDTRASSSNPTPRRV